MAYSLISVSDLTELKSRRGNSTNTTMATLMGLNFPLIEAWSVYVWDNTSTATADDDEVVQPTIGGITTGRWFKVDLDVAPQVNADWNSSSGASMILNKPSIFSGDYEDLINLPILFSGDYADLYNLPDLFDGNYSSLSGIPNIPSDTSELSNGAGFITVVPAQGWASITGKPSFSTVATSGSYTDLSNKPSIPTISGATGTYGIMNVSNGLVSSGKRQETYTGTTSGSGTYTVVYGTPYSVEPNVIISQKGGTPTNSLVLNSSSTTGFTVTANNRVELLGLLPTYPTLNGAVVNVLVTEK